MPFQHRAGTAFAKNPPWLSLCEILFGFLAGAILAIGHHIFYKSLAGKPVPNGKYHAWGLTITAQQVNVAAGTAFAFLVKASLGSTLSTAYVQSLWRSAKRGSGDLTLSELDIAFSASSSLLSLLKVWRWRFPLLFVLAWLTWIVPLASIVPPATLSIDTAAVNPPRSGLEEVPNVNFASLNYFTSQQYYDTIGAGQGIPIPANVEYFTYTGPTAAVKEVVEAVGSQGLITPIASQGLNSSWMLEFSAPAVTCALVSDSIRQDILNNIVQAINAQDCTYYGFLSWNSGLGVPGSGSPKCGNSSLPFTVSNNTVQYPGTCLSSSNDAPTVTYLALLPQMGRFGFAGPAPGRPCLSTNQSQQVFQGSTIVQCALRNSTYVARFKDSNGVQHINVTTKPTDATPLSGARNDSSGTMSALGMQWIAYKDCVTFLWDVNFACQSPHGVLSALSYQSIMAAFDALFHGSAVWSDINNNFELDTSIADTVLGRRLDLSYLKKDLQPIGHMELGGSGPIVRNNVSALVNDFTSSTLVPLTKAIEDLFEKSVVSMMSSPELQADYSALYAPPLVNVTYHTFHNVYIYSLAKLWISYGVGLLITLLAAMIGIDALLVNRGSYSLNFSTMLRVTRNSNMSVELKREDTDGKDPLPPYLAEARIRLSRMAGGADRNAEEDKIKVGTTDSSLLLQDN